LANLQEIENLQDQIFDWSVPEAVRSKAWVCGRSFAGIAVSNPAGSIDIRLITCPKDSCRVWCVECVWSWSPIKGCHVPESGRREKGKSSVLVWKIILQLILKEESLKMLTVQCYIINVTQEMRQWPDFLLQYLNLSRRTVSRNQLSYSSTHCTTLMWQIPLSSYIIWWRPYPSICFLNFLIYH
jgi:hypothetical protein